MYLRPRGNLLCGRPGSTYQQCRQKMSMPYLQVIRTPDQEASVGRVSMLPYLRHTVLHAKSLNLKHAKPVQVDVEAERMPKQLHRIPQICAGQASATYDEHLPKSTDNLLGQHLTTVRIPYHRTDLAAQSIQFMLMSTNSIPGLYPGLSPGLLRSANRILVIPSRP